MIPKWENMDKETLSSLACEYHIPAAKPKEVRQQSGVWIVVKGEGATITDINGRQYLDAVGGGTLAVGLGYGREEIAKAIYEQALQLHYCSPYLGVTPPAILLAKKLAEITPGSLLATYFSSGGSEAVESAIKLAKQYHIYNGEPLRYKVIARRHAYHGTTMGALSCMGGGPDLTIIRSINEPLMIPGVSHIPAPYCYRCDLGLTYPNCELACAQALTKEIEYQGPETISAFIVESVIGSGGCIIPVPEYLPMVRSICDQYGVLMIVDEVMSGFGRTGKWFACNHWNVVPDIMTLAKNMSGCYVPLGAAIIRSELYGKMPVFLHVHTFSGHPVACAAGLVTIDIMEKENLVENAAEVGAYLLDGLKTLTKHRIVGDVRGLGMMLGVELVKDKKTKERFHEERIADQVTVKALDYGVFVRVGGGDVIEIGPILTFTRKDADRVIDALDRSLTEVEKQVFS